MPEIDPSAYIHPDAVVIGAVTVGPKSSVWPTAVLRADHGRIVIGAETSIQDGTVIHVSTGLDTVIGDRCVVGHNAHIEGAVVEDDALVGSGSVLLHHVRVCSHAIVAAGAVVKEGTLVPSFALAVGVPAKVKVDAVTAGAFDSNVAMYLHNVEWYSRELRRLD